MIFSRLGRSLSRLSRAEVEAVRVFSPFHLIFFFLFPILFWLWCLLSVYLVSQGVPLRGYGYGSGISHRTLPRSPISQGDGGGLGYLRGYLTSIGAESNAATRGQFNNWRFLLANPSFRRFFSSESPNKKSEMRCYIFSTVFFLSRPIEYYFWDFYFSSWIWLCCRLWKLPS